MPRRRRNSSSQRKPSLMFTESPVNNSRCAISPVKCANHPPTAKVIPVEELADLTWVSPQFHGAPDSGKRRGGRRRNLSRSSVNTRSRVQGVGKENLQQSFGSRRRLLQGFVPLRFELEKSMELTEIEDVSDVDAEPDLNFTRNADLDHASYNTSAVVTPKQEVDGKDHTGAGRHSNIEQEGEAICSSSASPRFHLNLSTLNHLCRTSGLSRPAGHRARYEDPDGQPDTSHVRRSARLRDKYREALELFRSPCKTNVCEGQQCQVLVLDTPESEYGLIQRRRRLQPRKGYS